LTRPLDQQTKRGETDRWVEKAIATSGMLIHLL
jgi:hypothetical protein